MLDGTLVLQHEGVHPRADLARRESDVLCDAVVKRNLVARSHVLLLVLRVLPEEESVVWKSIEFVTFLAVKNVTASPDTQVRVWRL